MTPALVVLLAAGCLQRDGIDFPGTAGAPCYPNGTCDAGLSCSSEGVCVGEEIRRCAGVTCSNRGQCVVRDGAPSCVCTAGYRNLGLSCVALTGCTPTPRALALCDGGDVYWFDGCGARGELRQDCGDAGCSGGACTGSAPEGMVLLPDFAAGAFWIDVYEASLTGFGELGDEDQDRDGDGKIADAGAAAAHALSHGLVFDDDGGEESVRLTTVASASVPLALPIGNLTFYQAAAACTRAGKRLCTDAEWRAACQNGPAFTRYPYGETYDGGDEAGADCWTDGLSNGLEVTGSASACVTANGIFDLSGNAAEWTSLPASDTARLHGGDLAMNGSGVTCTSFETLPPWSTSFWLSFRCCRDL